MSFWNVPVADGTRQVWALNQAHQVSCKQWCIYIHIYICIYTDIYIYVCIHIHMHISIYIHTYISSAIFIFHPDRIRSCNLRMDPNYKHILFSWYFHPQLPDSQICQTKPPSGTLAARRVPQSRSPELLGQNPVHLADLSFTNMVKLVYKWVTSNVLVLQLLLLFLGGYLRMTLHRSQWFKYVTCRQLMI